MLSHKTIETCHYPDFKILPFINRKRLGIVIIQKMPYDSTEDINKKNLIEFCEKTVSTHLN